MAARGTRLETTASPPSISRFIMGRKRHMTRIAPVDSVAGEEHATSNQKCQIAQGGLKLLAQVSSVPALRRTASPSSAPLEIYVRHIDLVVDSSVLLREVPVR
eukprot:6169976-Amphidinium_carterae.1